MRVTNYFTIKKKKKGGKGIKKEKLKVEKVNCKLEGTLSGHDCERKRREWSKKKKKEGK